MKSKLISFVICETARAKKGKEAAAVGAVKSAPHYFDKTVPQQFILTQEKIKLENREGMLTFKSYPPDFLLAEVHFDIADMFAEGVVEFKEKAIAYCRETLKRKGGKDVDEFSEEYSTYVVTKDVAQPEWFAAHKDKIAAILKSERLPLDPAEVEYTILSQLKYSKGDLVIVDWDGAFVFEPAGDFEQTVELFELANLQLLRYRILDRDLDLRFQRVTDIIEKTPLKSKFLFEASDLNLALRETMLLRSRSVSEFQALEREIKLIGDWYSARLYELLAKKFKLEEWRATVKDKLSALEKTYAVASENFTFSWEKRSRIIEMVGWYILLLGWLILLVLDFYLYKFK